jgi:ABC-type multidrug transport system fused ATPase/permease subunit
MFNLARNQSSSGRKPLLPFYWRIVVRPNIREAFLLCLLMLSNAVLGVVGVGLTMPLLDAMTKSGSTSPRSSLSLTKVALKWLGLPDSTHMVLLALLIGVGVVFLMQSALALCCQYFTAVIGNKLFRQVRLALFERFLYARYEDLSTKGRAAILNDIQGPSGAIQANITALGSLFMGIFNSAMFLGFMFYLSWWVTLVVGVLAFIGLSGFRRFIDWRSEACGRSLYKLQEDQVKLQVDAIDGVKVVKVHRLEQRLVEQVRSLLRAEKRPTLQLVLLGSGPSFIHEAGAILVVLGLAGITFLVPSAGMKLSTLGAFLLALRRFGSAISSINSVSVDLHRSRKSVEVIEEILYLTPLEKQGERPAPKVEELKLVDLSFRYACRPGHWALKNIDLTARRGTVTALAGPTGSGKSTVANLLIGLYDPVSGSILVNGADLRELNLTDWRKKIGYVSQDTFLFNATLRENIALWDETISQEEVEWAARMAQLHDFVTTLPEGYETMVGDRGLRLSGGQCQRVAIARAILRRPEVMIFDEATSALDNLTETAVYDALSNLREEAIVIVIAHRLSTIKNVDQIIVLWSGRIIETGTHNALINARGAYAKLYEGDAGEGTEGLGEMGQG